MPHYLINKDVTFYPESNVLYSKDDNIKVNMLTPSGQCLLILLENKGNIVSKKEIYEFVWERYGLTVTDNAFYQTVLYLRKNLKEVGLLTEIVKTVPRKGMLVPSSVQVDKIALQDDTPASSPIVADSAETEPVFSEAVLQHYDTEEVTLSPQKQDSPVLATDDIIEEARLNTEDRKTNRTFRYPIYLWLSLITSIILFSAFVIYWQEPTKNADYFAHYTQVAELEGCRIFIDPDISTLEEYNKYTFNTPVNCNKNPYIYFTKVSFIKRSSLIACKNEITKWNKRNECISFYKIIK